jgi:protein SCO1/2
MRYSNTRHLALILALVLLGTGNMAAGESSESQLHANVADPHAAHRKMMTVPDIRVDHLAYQVPDVELIDDSGKSASLQDLLAVDQPVTVNFIFTTCTTICPVMTATMLQLQKNLESDAVRPNYISISIDPDYDSAAIMKEYAARYGADWTFLTGTPDDVLSTLHAFDAYRGNKINHFALTLMRAANDDQWTRIEGLTSAKELARIWRETAL